MINFKSDNISKVLGPVVFPEFMKETIRDKRSEVPWSSGYDNSFTQNRV